MNQRCLLFNVSKEVDSKDVGLVKLVAIAGFHSFGCLLLSFILQKEEARCMRRLLGEVSDRRLLGEVSGRGGY